MDVSPYAEGDAVVTVLTAGRGLWRGLVRGGASRTKIAIWQKGNVIQARWAARLAEQLGNLTGELVHPAAALAMADRVDLAVLEAACALAAGALSEREPHPGCFAGLVRLMAAMGAERLAVPGLIKWELELLRELGFGLDFSGPDHGNDRLAFVSPRTGRAVPLSVAGTWVDRLLPLPRFLLDDSAARLADWLDGLRLTGHFLARDAFGARHQPLPPARQRLYDLLATEGERGNAG